MIGPCAEKSRLDSRLLGDWPGVAIELDFAIEPRDAFLRLCHLPYCLFFDSAAFDPTLGRFSFIAVDPFDTLIAAADDRSVWSKLEATGECFVAPTIPELPPFQGGMAGLFSYELSRTLERLPTPGVDEFHVPGLAVGMYDVVVAFDHLSEKAWIVSQGFPETVIGARRERAVRRAELIRTLLAARDLSQSAPSLLRLSSARIRIDAKGIPADRSRSNALADSGLLSNFSRDQYLAVVQRGIDYVCAGDVFQVNLAQRLLYPAIDDPVSLYLRLREKNPAPFAAYFDLDDYQILSASPERFLSVNNGKVEARPIKGTRARGEDSSTDAFAAKELQASEKDRAENVMIVDLLRNDLSRVCRPESVIVSELCRLERYAFVQHLVSVVQGQLREDATAIDLIKAAFPGGSVTGAPKVRAMEIIAELERTARGAYCGAMGYVGFDGAMDSSILIRTITAGGGWWQFPVGGGIVAQSDPQREYEETWAKAEGILIALK